jgi:tripartite-type tricarboxylate transporter receptor subunit TctC
VATLLESGVPVEAYLWMGMFTTAGTPAPIVSQLNNSLGRILATGEMKDWLAKSFGGEFIANAPEQFGAFVATDAARWLKVIKDTGVMLD